MIVSEWRQSWIILQTLHSCISFTHMHTQFWITDISFSGKWKKKRKLNKTERFTKTTEESNVNMKINIRESKQREITSENILNEYLSYYHLLVDKL